MYKKILPLLVAAVAVGVVALVWAALQGDKEREAVEEPAEAVPQRMQVERLYYKWGGGPTTYLMTFEGTRYLVFYHDRAMTTTKLED